MTDKHKRITKAQFDIWIDNPVTKTFIQCLGWSIEQMDEVIAKGGYIDSSNNDLSMNQLHSALGEKAGLSKAGDPLNILTTHELLEAEEEDETSNTGDD